MNFKTILVSCVYISAIATANLLVAMYGPGVTIINAFVLIGLDLSLRDYLHDVWEKHRAVKMASLIVAAGTISYAINPAAGKIALASLIAFMLAASCDWIVYHALRNHAWFKRANVSNVTGAAVDSIAFPILAFGWPPLIAIIVGQFIAKALGGLVWTTLIGGVRVAARHNRTS